METVGHIAYFGVLVLFAATLTMRRRADDWDGLPFPQRFILAVSASRNWWLAYSVAYLALLMGRYQKSFHESVPVVLVAIGLAALLSIFRIPR